MKRYPPTITHNLILYSSEHSTENEFPLFKQFDGVPPRIIPFNEALTSRDYEAFVHFFIDDYQFERVWARPLFYREKLCKFAGLIAPDFSVLTGMSHMSLLWNTYRSRVIAAFYAKEGMNVIPCVSWDKNFQKNAFFYEGIEQGKTIAISTNGVFRDKETRETFIGGAEEMARRLRPKTILVYGFEIPFNANGANVVYYNNHFLERLRKRPLTEKQLKKKRDELAKYNAIHSFDIDAWKRIYKEGEIEMYSLWRTPFVLDGDPNTPIEFDSGDISSFLKFKLKDGRTVDEILRAVEYRIQFKETFVEENTRNSYPFFHHQEKTSLWEDAEQR